MTLTPQILGLIDKQDCFEIVRDQVAGILVVESENQEVLATADGKDPLLWRLRVFAERSNPWSEFIESPAPGTADAVPIVNVWYSSDNVDAKASNVVERQKHQATINVDCYGYGVSKSNGAGHIPGDEMAAKEAQRAMRLVRNILMAGPYTYLGLRGVVSRRMTGSRTMFQPPQDAQTVQHICGARYALEVDFNELSPQFEGEPLELISVELKRASNGQLYIRQDFDYTA